MRSKAGGIIIGAITGPSSDALTVDCRNFDKGNVGVLPKEKWYGSWYALGRVLGRVEHA